MVITVKVLAPSTSRPLADEIVVVVAAKSTSNAQSVSPFPPDPNSPQSTISTVEREIREAGGEATAIAVDVRDFESVKRCVDKTVEVMQRPSSYANKLTRVSGK